MSEPRMVRIAAGWAAMGDGWAVHGATEEEARRQFEIAQRRHREIDARPLRPVQEQTYGNP